MPLIAGARKRAGVPKELVEKAVRSDRLVMSDTQRAVVSDGLGRCAELASRLGILGIPSSARVMRSCIAARTPPKPPAE